MNPTTEQPPDTAAPADPTPPAAPDRPRARSGGDDTIADIDGIGISRGEVVDPIYEEYGLNSLLTLVQLRLAERAAQRQGVTVTQAEIQQEREETLRKAFRDVNPSDYDRALDQLLIGQRLSPGEFDRVMHTNAILRKLTAPAVEARINDATLREAFNVLYGGAVQVRHIQLNNMQEVAEAKRRVEAGQDFAQVARDMSRNAQTAPLGGELPPFSRETSSISESVRQAAFALKEGEVSDAVSDGNTYHLIKLERSIEPTVVKFDDVKDSVAQRLRESAQLQALREMRAQLGREALENLKITDPVLRARYEKRFAEQQRTVKGRDRIIDAIEQDQSTQQTTAGQAGPGVGTAAGGVSEVTPVTPAPATPIEGPPPQPPADTNK